MLIKYRYSEAVASSNAIPQPFEKLVVGDGSYLYMSMTANCRRRKLPLKYSLSIKVVHFDDSVKLSDAQKKKVQETRMEVLSSPKLARHEEFYMSHYIWFLVATDHYTKEVAKYDDVFYLYDDESIQSTKNNFSDMLNN